MSSPVSPDQLDQAILNARAGSITPQELGALLMQADLAIPSRTDVVREFSELKPILLDKGKETLVAAYSRIEQADAFRNLAPFCMVTPARGFLQILPADLGLVLNPGLDTVVQFSAEGVQQMLADFAQQ